jgi:PDZ domain-containing protein GIPC
MSCLLFLAEAIAARSAAPAATEVKANAGKKTVRMKGGAGATVQDDFTDANKVIIDKIDDLLEKFIGIKDNDLSTTLFETCKVATEPEIFAGLLDTKLQDFEFPDDFVLDVYELVHKK